MDKVCPRCKLNPIGAGLSRTDSKTNICPDCEQVESFQDHFDGKVTPQSEWPVKAEVRQ